MSIEDEFHKEGSSSGDLYSLIHVHAYSAPARLISVALQVIAVLNILYVAAHSIHSLVEGTPIAPPHIIALGLLLLSGVPAITVTILRRLLRATVSVQPPRLVLTLRRARFEIPLTSIKAIRPWWIPLPGPGLALQMASDRRFRYRLELGDPSELVSAIGASISAEQNALTHPSIAYASARQLLGKRSLCFLLVKFGLFPLALAVILFRLQQYIMFGGPFGQYHLFVLFAYLKSFARELAGTAAGFVVYAGVWRFLAEICALPLTWALPSRARFVRRSAEVICQIAYFGLIPAYVLARLLL